MSLRESFRPAQTAQGTTIFLPDEDGFPIDYHLQHCGISWIAADTKAQNVNRENAHFKQFFDTVASHKPIPYAIKDWLFAQLTGCHYPETPARSHHFQTRSPQPAEAVIYTSCTESGRQSLPDQKPQTLTASGSSSGILEEWGGTRIYFS